MQITTNESNTPRDQSYLAKASKEFQNGINHYQQGNIELAKKCFLRCTIDMPSNNSPYYNASLHYQAYSYLAECCKKLGSWIPEARARKQMQAIAATYLQINYTSTQLANIKLSDTEDISPSRKEQEAIPTCML